VFGRTGAVIAAQDDYTFAQLASKPTTLSGYGITDAQALDSDLTAIAALTPTNDDIIQRKAGAWTNRTIAQLKADLSLSGSNTGDQTITLTGDVTGSGTGSFATTLANLPSGVPMAGSLLATNIAAPSTPATGKTSVYVDSTSKNFAAKNDAGTVNHGVQTRTASASNWIRAIADDGSTTISQPAFTDISGSVAASQMPALTGDVTTSAGAVATTIGANKVTNAMLATVSTATFKGRTTAGTGNVEDLTATQATALLNAMVGDSGSGGTKGLVPAPASGDAAAGKFLKADGTFAVPTASVSFANPTASVGLTAVNGSASTVMRSDAAPALDVTIAPTWSGAHTHTNTISLNSTTAANNKITQGGAVNIGTTSTDGIVLQNTTAAAVGAQQYSPRLRLTGQGWKTNSTAASQTVDWILEARPVQGAANPTVNLALLYQVNGGGYTDAVATGGILAPGGGSASQSVVQYSAVNNTSNGLLIGGGNAGNGVSIRVNGTAVFAADGNIGSTAGIAANLDFLSTPNSFTGRLARLAATSNVVRVGDSNATGVGSMLFGRVITAKTSNYTVVNTDSHTFFTNTGAAGTVNFTLPTAAAGLTYTFYIDAAQTLTITAGASTTIRSGSSVTTSAGNVTSSTQGNLIRITAISTTQWIADFITGTWTFN
jgi:hypothetical protein